MNQNRKIIEVCFPDGKIKQYEYKKYKKLYEEIIKGQVKKDYRCRIINKSGEQIGNNIETKEWSTLEKISTCAIRILKIYVFYLSTWHGPIKSNDKKL